MKKIMAIVLCMILALSCISAFATGPYVQATGSVNIRKGPGLAYETMGSINKGMTLTYANSSSIDNRNVTWYAVYFNGNIGWISSVYSILYGASAPVVPETPKTTTYVQATASVNLRSGPGLGYDDIGTLTKGEKVVYLNSSSVDARGVTWYFVQYYSMGTGWISSTYSKLVVGGASEQGVPEKKNTYGSIVVATKGKSNLRSGPGLSYDDMGTIHKGESATYLNKSSTDERGVVWYYVNFNGKIGWISSRYTTLK